MGKKSAKGDPEERARKKLSRAQIKLGMAEEKHAQERERGKQEIEQARLRAAKWLARAAQRVERRRAAVAEADGHLQALQQKAATGDRDASSPDTIILPSEHAAPETGLHLTNGHGVETDTTTETVAVPPDQPREV